MTLHRITVECYAGQTADERPRRLMIAGREHFVARLLAESVEESLVTKGRTRRFKVLTDEALVLEVVRASDGKWYYDPESA